MSHKTGSVFLVGAGPGSEDLVTLKAFRLLRDADVVVYDNLANDALLNHTKLDAERIYVGKQAGKHTLKQEEINSLLIRKAGDGKKVIRLKGGDPYVFGRGGEEAMALRAAEIYFEIVPGITAGTATLAYAGIPATHRGMATSVSFITGHEDPTKPESELNWDAIANLHGTLVFYMGINNLEKITGMLQHFGKPGNTQAAVIRYGSLPIQRTITGTLENIAEKVNAASLKPPAIIVVGDVIGLRDELNWFETKPLFGKRIVVTRSRAQASNLVAMLESLGCEVLPFPTIKITPPDSYEELDQAVKNARDYAWIVFPSANSVQFFIERLSALGYDARALAGVNLCAIGSATAERLHGFGLVADLIPREFVAEAVVEAFKDKKVSGQHFLLLRADIAPQTICNGLKNLGVSVDDVVVYKNIIDDGNSSELLNLIRKGDFDLVTFTSSSTVKNFLSHVGKNGLQAVLHKAKVACIGPKTKKTAAGFGISTDITPEKYTIPDLVDAIVKYYDEPKKIIRQNS